jgi:cleavage and polyadenylation specificity factor subunit 3
VVSSSNEILRRRVGAVLDIALSTISSLTQSFTSGIPLSEGNVAPSKVPGDTDAATLSDDGDVLKKSGHKNAGIKTSMKGPGRREEGESDESDFEGILEVHD